MRLPLSTWILAACIALLALGNVALDVQVRATAAAIDQERPAEPETDDRRQLLPPERAPAAEDAPPTQAAPGSV